HQRSPRAGQPASRALPVRVRDRAGAEDRIRRGAERQRALTRGATRPEATAATRPAASDVASRWLPVVAWASLIWLLSSDYFSGEQTGGFLLPLLELLLPGASPATLEAV